MRWDRFFEDLEDQLDSEWEAERAALDSEAERLRLSRVTLRERVAALCGEAAGEVSLEVTGSTALSGRIGAVGKDWVALERPAAERPGADHGPFVVPLVAISTLRLAHTDLLRSARPAASGPRSALAERMTLGFVLRDAARRRIGVTVQLADGHALSGTIDRAGADHLDLALHDPGLPRRGSEVTGFRLVPFGAIAWVRLESAALPLS